MLRIPRARNAAKEELDCPILQPITYTFRKIATHLTRDLVDGLSKALHIGRCDTSDRYPAIFGGVDRMLHPMSALLSMSSKAGTTNLLG